MKGLLSPQKKTRVESNSSSPRRPGREPPLLPTSALSEALSVLVCDVEEHADDASRAMAGGGGGRKAQACMARARHSLEELKKQAKKAPRGISAPSFLIVPLLQNFVCMGVNCQVTCFLPLSHFPSACMEDPRERCMCLIEKSFSPKTVVLIFFFRR